jgi:hypothetical protein
MECLFPTRFLLFLSMFLPFSVQLFALSPEKHVHLMHLDGLESNAFRALLETGQLPHFQFLINRGRLSHEATTVDKSETMKVILSYLTSQTDTDVVGWWQFNRDQFRFRNFWLDPVEVLHYALGVEFPSDPTIFDFLSYKGLEVTSGFGLHRRSVPFDNYGRAYLPSIKAATGNHHYYDQAHASMESTLELYRKGVVENNMPTFTTSLLAPADEYIHLVGSTVPVDSYDPIHCIKKEDDSIYKIFFSLLEKDFTGDQRLTRLIQTTSYFPNTEPSASMKQICIALPNVTIAGKERQLRPEATLGIMLLDIEIGNLIETLRNIQPHHHKWTFEAIGNRSGIDHYEPTNSLFERTLLLLTGDHGMVDTPKKMGVSKDVNRESRKLSFIESLNCQFRLATPVKGSTEKQEAYFYTKNENCYMTSYENPITHTIPMHRAKIGIDQDHLPLTLSSPYLFIPKDHPLFSHKKEAEDWAREFISFLTDGLKKWYYEQHKITSFFSSFTVDIVQLFLDKKLKPIESNLINQIAHTYLKGIPEYVEWETHFLQQFYEKHVQLVYGGGALNNAEIFIPSRTKDGSFEWGRRPSFQEILSYDIEGLPLLTILRSDPAVELTFVRENTRQESERTPMRIHVWDENKAEGLLLVKKEPSTNQLLFSYESAQPGKREPLGYADQYKDQWLTYHQWNDISIQQKNHPYHNVVAGIGSYLYSKNPAIGDILLMAKRDWNFGDNMGGHGGILREEKQTSMLISHGSLTPGVLSTEKGHHPTILDLTPTILDWLGYTPGDMEAFAKNGAFEAHMKKWIQSQEGSILSNAPNLLQRLAEEVHYGLLIQETEFQKKLKRFLQFMPKSFAPTKDLSQHRLQGEKLFLPQKKSPLS